MALARFLLATLTFVLSVNAAQRQLTTTSFTTCIANSTIIASSFNVTIFENRTVSFFLNGTSPVSAHEFVGFQLNVAGEQKWGYTYDPCVDSYPLLASFCPNIPEGAVVRTQSLQLPAKVVLRDLFTDGSLDANFRFVLTNETSLNNVGCLEAKLSNSGNGSESSSGAERESGAGMGYVNWALIMVSLMSIAGVGSIL